jgi:shikimate kinase
VTGPHLVLIGMMGTGKTTVGRRLADHLGRPFLDSDERVEAGTGRTVAEIFATDGEAAFRAIETDVLRTMLDAPEPSVIAAAGGAVLDAGNRALMRARSTVVWLVAPPDVLAERVASGSHRPLLDTDPAGTLRRLATERDALYRETADRIVQTGSTAPDAVVDEVLQAIGAAA